MSGIVESLGQRIRHIRNERQMSQEELAFKAGISAAHLGQIERALKNPTIDTISKIAGALNVPLSDLFREESVVPTKESRTMEKICAYLAAKTEEEQNNVLRIVRIFKAYLPKQ